jgi:hypothetical protein
MCRQSPAPRSTRRWRRFAGGRRRKSGGCWRGWRGARNGAGRGERAVCLTAPLRPRRARPSPPDGGLRGTFGRFSMRRGGAIGRRRGWKPGKMSSAPRVASRGACHAHLAPLLRGAFCLCRVSLLRNQRSEPICHSRLCAVPARFPDLAPYRAGLFVFGRPYRKIEIVHAPRGAKPADAMRPSGCVPFGNRPVASTSGPRDLPRFGGAFSLMRGSATLHGSRSSRKDTAGRLSEGRAPRCPTRIHRPSRRRDRGKRDLLVQPAIAFRPASVMRSQVTFTFTLRPATFVS